MLTSNFFIETPYIFKLLIYVITLVMSSCLSSQHVYLFVLTSTTWCECIISGIFGRCLSCFALSMGYETFPSCFGGLFFSAYLEGLSRKSL
ncbi:hypothetical protein P167DRAFT_12183 [Morchella conica CCBAS932]|uniref:Uncharacterized protein n=1 Tax=Morchella conica CCBAS932 TaxID=1392247 RepID=A0A3N4L8H1_9PEZI|nr:hypothetical protein P167DRAFT_12183 [Morchella conica CCBAS932]